MTNRKMLALATALVTLLAFSATALLAQEETATVVPMPDATETVVPPPSFTDGRINGSVSLGGLALYCVDKNSNTHVTTFDNGAITVWGVADQKYINLSANQLRGDVEIPQMPSQMQMAEMTEMPAAMATMEVTEIDEAAATAMPPGQSPILLARADTPNGEIGFFTLGGDEFALQGYDENGKFYTYTWTGCSTGTLDNSTEAYMPLMQATPEMTAEATTSP